MRNPRPDRRDGTPVKDSRWPLIRAMGLALGVAMLSPLSPLVLVGLPLAVTLLAFRTRAPLAIAVAAVLLGFVFNEAGSNPSPVWFAERAWGLLLAGGFVVAKLAMRDKRLFPVSIAAVGISFGVVVLVGLIRPSLVAELDWWVTAQLDRSALAAYQLLEPGGERWTVVGAAIQTVVALETVIYPALLGLASLCALGLVSYVMRRLEGVEAALAPLRDFRFSDQLAWLLVLGLILFIVPAGDWAARLGENVVAFMSGLYLLRGAAVLVWLSAAVVTSGWAVALCILAALLLYPIALGAALVMGLSDTWLDLRNRLGVDASDGKT